LIVEGPLTFAVLGAAFVGSAVYASSISCIAIRINLLAATSQNKATAQMAAA
jgi:hypothetical protein